MNQQQTFKAPPLPPAKRPPLPPGFIVSEEPDIFPMPKRKRVFWDNEDKLWYRNDVSGEETDNGADGLPELIDAFDFLAEPIDAPPELVAGILHAGSKLVFGGSSKSYKTWVLLDLAISVATGADWLGRQTAQGKVLFVNFEIQPYAWQQRIAAV